nr:VanW family protein [uncultured Blautia sp.]
MKKQMKNGVIRVLILILILITVYGLWCHFLTDNVIWKKLKVNGIAIQGMTKEEAIDAISKDFQEKYKDTQMTVTLNGKKFKISIYPVLGLDIKSIVESAYSLGHGSWFTHGTDRIQLMNDKTKEEVTLMPEARNKDTLDDVLEEAGITSGSTTVQTSCGLTDTELIITKGKTGIGPDMSALKEDILKAISIEDYTASIECPTMETPPEELDMEAYYEEVHTDAQDAALGENNEIIPAVTGISFNVKSAERKLKKAGEGEVITIPLEITLPDVSTEEIEALPYLNLLGTYTTYGGGTDNRIANLKLAVEACDGVELQPGQIFSYNDTLGPRTEERGYREATVIVGGEHAQDIGGGICQISTTLYMACLQADLAIIERHNHAARIDYVDDGLDAAVVWGGQDFRFQNNTSYPVKITASYDEKEEAVTVSIYGTKTDNNQVEITTEHSDSNTCRTYRSVYDEEGTLLRKEEVGYSQYKQ